MIGTLDRKRGIVNINVLREGRKTCLSMDHALAMLALDLFEGDAKALHAWLQQRCDAIDARLGALAQTADLGQQVAPASGFSRLVQREIIDLARMRLRQLRGAPQDLAAEPDALAQEHGLH